MYIVVCVVMGREESGEVVMGREDGGEVVIAAKGVPEQVVCGVPTCMTGLVLTTAVSLSGDSAAPAPRQQSLLATLLHSYTLSLLYTPSLLHYPSLQQSLSLLLFIPCYTLILILCKSYLQI